MNKALSNNYFKNSPDSEPTRFDYLAIFNTSCNRLEKATVSKLYENMNKYSKFNAIIDYFFEKFHFNLKKNLTKDEFLDVIKEIQVIRDKKETIKEVIPIKPRKTIMKRLSIEVVNNTPKPSPLMYMLFSKFDKNHDGLVNIDELRLGLDKFLTSDSIESLFNEYDSDNNKTLDIYEFMKLFTPKSDLVELNL